MHEIDARGLSCPEPAMMAMDALDDYPDEPFKVLVSSATAKVNVSEIAAKKGRKASAQRIGDDYEITIE